jgi:hypothetical protein
MLAGAIYILFGFFGLSMLVSGILLRTRIALCAALAIGCAVFAALVSDMI